MNDSPKGSQADSASDAEPASASESAPEPAHERPAATGPDAATEPDGALEPETIRGWRLSRRGWTVMISFVIVVALGLIGGFVQVPYVALGPGPTYDTLGDVDNVPVVEVDGERTYATNGQLRMTTVSITSEVSLFGALGLWVSGRYALAPREEYIKPGETEEDLERENSKMFRDSQSAAEVAALRHLEYPIKVVAREVTNGAPADGVIAPGDELLVVNGHRIRVQEDVPEALKGTRPGQAVSVTVAGEDGTERTDTITLGRATDFGAEDRAEGFLGLAPVDRADVDFETSIHLEDVGGPSAGLIFALAIVDKLERGPLGGDHVIAGTGEIDVKGNVRPIGGIPFKMMAAREAGADTFLVPEDNCAEAVEQVPDGLRLIKVSTLDDAVASLEKLAADGEPAGC